MIVIFEGINGIGKTTQANFLAKKTHFSIYKTFGPNREYIPDDKNIIDFFKKGYIDYVICDFARQVPLDAIFDRSILSSYSYETANNLKLIQQWWKIINKIDFKIIFLYVRNFDIIQNRIKQRRILLNPEYCPKIVQDRYELMFSKLSKGESTNIFKLCVDNLSKQEVFLKIWENFNNA